MKKATIVTLALMLVLAASTFASAANYIGGGLGIVGMKPAADPETGITLTLALDYDVMDKLTFSANGYIGIKKVEAGSTSESPLGNYDIVGLGGGYAKYALASFDALKLGAVAGARYNYGFAPYAEKDARKGQLNYGAGVFAEQALGETGTIFGQVMYWVNPDGPTDATITDHIGGLGGINFKITDKIGVKGQVEYIRMDKDNNYALFSIGVGYAF